ncbi:MAG: DUF6351 family protein [Acidimicrobiales bacterium]
MAPPTRSRRRRTSARSTATTAAVIALALSLLVAACSSGGGDDAAPTTTTERSQGGPTTTAPDGSGGSGADPTDPVPLDDGIAIVIVSSQPDRVSGPEARVRVRPAKGEDPAGITVKLGDLDVTGQLQVVDGALEGVVSGFIEGTNTLTAEAGGDRVTQRVRAWPLAGPMISGPHLPLLACSTEAHGLGAPTDADCSAPTTVRWSYVTTTGQVADLTDPNALPADVARADVDGNQDLPLVIRHEVGVVDRAVYEIASIDPSPGGADSSQADAAWNGRLLYRYGDGCGATFGQGTSSSPALDPAYLRAGYAVATATANTGAVLCNDVLSAETTMMVKERFIEEFGEPELTIGEGVGGGAGLLHLMLQNYPGLVDAAVALDPLPDHLTVANGIADCVLLQRYYATPAGSALTPAQRTAIGGSASERTCQRWAAGAGSLFDPAAGCDPAADPARIYDLATNPGGTRCTLQDANVNQLGRVPGGSFAARPLDNVGVQYGLEAFNDGTISFDEFTALNEAVGGLDPDGKPQAPRHAADPVAVQTAYETGRVSTGVGDQRKVPVIEVDRDDDASGAPNDRFRAFSLRDRLTLGASAKTVPSFQVWSRPADDASAGPDAVAAVDEWATALVEEPGGGSRSEQLERTRPTDAVDSCTPTGSSSPVRGTDVWEEDGPCAEAFPIGGDTRTAAGAPRSDDVLKCQLKPVDPDDYERRLTDAQIAELEQVFPEGVCDWAVAGVGQSSPSMTDRTYEDVESPADLA